MIPDRPQELVIVRRRNPLFQDPPKGGVWKIAYADFMTAMMAFFLVMWLINVTDDAVKKGVAQYFNPVNLAATSPNRKGLNDPDQTGVTNEDGRNKPEGDAGTDSENHGVNKARRTEAKTPAATLGKGATVVAHLEAPTTGSGDAAARGGEFAASYSEDALFSDPYAVLDKLASSVPGPVTEEDGSGNAGFGDKADKGARGGDAYRDPFDPLYWQFTPQGDVEGGSNRPAQAAVVAAVVNGDPEKVADVFKPMPKAKPVEGDEKNDPSHDVHIMERIATGTGTGAPDGAYVENKTARELAAPAGAGTGKGPGTGPGTKTAATSDPAMRPGTNEHPGTAEHLGTTEIQGSTGQQRTPEQSALAKLSGADKSATAETAERLRKHLAAISSGPLRHVAAQVDVEQTDDGLLISLTDASNFGMFAIGSAEPRPQLVRLMEEIGKTISTAKGDIIIRGHTDARPFASGSYDNWRLSTARAHIAYYMLMRGGLDGQRVERVEGYADRDLKVPADPYAASNRRIEILLKEVHT